MQCQPVPAFASFPAPSTPGRSHDAPAADKRRLKPRRCVFRLTGRADTTKPGRAGRRRCCCCCRSRCSAAALCCSWLCHGCRCRVPAPASPQAPADVHGSADRGHVRPSTAPASRLPLAATEKRSPPSSAAPTRPLAGNRAGCLPLPSALDRCCGRGWVGWLGWLGCRPWMPPAQPGRLPSAVALLSPSGAARAANGA